MSIVNENSTTEDISTGEKMMLFYAKKNEVWYGTLGYCN
jgi:hypothetical protein